MPKRKHLIEGANKHSLLAEFTGGRIKRRNRAVMAGSPAHATGLIRLAHALHADRIRSGDAATIRNAAGIAL